MRFPLLAILFVTGCSGEANHLGNPLLWPFMAVSSGIENSINGARRGEVELTVKSNFDTIIPEIRAGGGPSLTLAMDQARIPQQDRPARILQLQSDLPLYQSNPGALVTALMVYGV